MVVVEKFPYHGWPNCQKISNGLVELIVTADVGPRIIHFGFKGGENQFYENPADAGVMGGDKWHSFGGHRLWHAPEDVIRTYAPDNSPVQVKLLKDGAKFTAPTEPNGIQKVIEVHLSESEPKVKVNHTLINHSLWPIPLAVWSVSVMKAGGKVIVPHSPRIGHDDRLLPNESFALWGYTKMDDPRWTWGEKYFFLRQDSSFNYAQKIGTSNSYGWAACQRNTDVFIKKFDFNPALVYPDFNCNFETYTDQSILEVETLGPNVVIDPGQKAEHLEEWSLHKGIKNITNDADADRLLLPLL
jgi:hypothetical protein